MYVSISLLMWMLAKNMVALERNSQSIVMLFLDWLCHTPHQKFLKYFVYTLFCLPGSHFQLRCTKFDYVVVPITSVVDRNVIQSDLHKCAHNSTLSPSTWTTTYVCNMHSLWCVDQIARVKSCESMSYVGSPTINICMLKNSTSSSAFSPLEWRNTPDHQ